MAPSTCLSVPLPAAEPAQHLLCFSTRTSAPPANRMPSKTLSPSPTGLCSWIVLMLTFHSLSGSSEASPAATVNREAVDLKSCLSASQLLKVANNRWLQLQEDVALAFNCTYKDMEIDDIMAEKAHTITGCLDNTSLMAGKCSEQSGHPFEKDICFKAIHKDLKLYREQLMHQADLSEAINDLIKALNFPEDRRTSVPSPPSKSRAFSEDLRECRLLLALRLRTVTINRIMNHLKSTLY